MTNNGGKFVVVDHGLYADFACQLKRAGAEEVVYAPVWSEGFPSYDRLDVGLGLPDITRITDFFKFKREVLKKDRNAWTIVFPFIYDGGLQEDLREDGFHVWGSFTGSDLELYRVFAKKVMDAAGLPVGPYHVVKGIDALRNFLKQHTGKVHHIKVSFLRGLTETFHTREWWQADLVLDELAHRLGAKKYEQEFVIEDDIPTDIEVGGDTISAGGKFLDVTLNGVEQKDAAYGFVLQKTENLPAEILETHDALAPVLRRYSYCNFFSTEIRIAKDGTAYPIDLTLRKPSPAGECEEKVFTNLPEIIREAARGRLVKARYKYRYGVEAILYSDKAEEEWQGVSFPEELRPWVDLYYHRRINGHDFTMPQRGTKMGECGAVVGLGDTPEEAEEVCRERAEQVTGDNLHIKLDKIEGVFEEFDAMKERGMDLSPAPKQS